MPRPTRIIVGQRYGRLEVLRRDGSIGPLTAWVCRCDCGKEVRLRSSVLTAGYTRSCGCLRAEVSAARLTTHGQSKTAVYRVYRTMLSRCYNENAIGYPIYGGRGIRVCGRWRESFENFYADMGPRPRGGTIERNDSNGDYCPENCRWATQKEQCNNTRRNHRLTFDGQTMTISQWGDRIGIDPAVLYCRINNYGWSTERALTEPVRRVTRKPKESLDGRNVSGDGSSTAAR